MSNLVIVGGGFAGMWAALSAARETAAGNGDIDITLLSQDPCITIRPRLYEANPERFRVPLKPVLDPAGVSLVEGTAGEIDPGGRSVFYKTPEGDDRSLAYDRLILTAGSVQKALPVPGADTHTWNVDTCAGAAALDKQLRHIMQDAEAAGHGTIVIIGAGFTGIELASEMRRRLAAHSDAGSAGRARVVLVEQAAVVGPELGANPRPVIEDALRSANVETRLGARVTRIGPDGVTLESGEQIETVTVIATTGLTANTLGQALAVELDALGRLPVDDMLRVSGVNDIFAAGDMARAYVDDEHVAAMSCQHAMMMGKFAGYNAARELRGEPPRPYRQPNYVTCLDLGDSGALFTTGWDRQVQMTGEEANQRKQMINTQWIYPPQGDRATILAAADIDARPGR